MKRRILIPMLLALTSINLYAQIDGLTGFFSKESFTLGQSKLAYREKFSAVTPAWHWNKKHWSDVYYEQLEDALVQELIKESYMLVASKLPKAIRQKYLHK